ncbi:MAG TPA: hypothetical protein VK400_15510 [Pyrinomonadaceae bacterium]|nr:hypothetical protein [Pyrinomonadaceae bacterium]
MKLRIKGNSIRLRLSQREVSGFEKNFQVEDSISFGNRRLTYVLSGEGAAREISARFENDRIEISVPRDVAEQWTQSAQIGFGAEQKLPGGEVLKILVEKDFACLAVREGEDETDAFPHPNMGQAC